MLALGPMPEPVRAVVAQLVIESRERCGFLLTGGPIGCSYLRADGSVWNWSAWDDTVEAVPDGPLKVALVAIAADRIPQLAAWLPSRPPEAVSCALCAGGGWLPPPCPRLLCPACSGVGWAKSEDAATL